MMWRRGFCVIIDQVTGKVRTLLAVVVMVYEGGLRGMVEMDGVCSL